MEGGQFGSFGEGFVCLFLLWLGFFGVCFGFFLSLSAMMHLKQN